MAHDAALALVVLGTVIVVGSSVGALRILLANKDPLDALHFVTPTTSLGAPLVGLGLSVENGWGLTTASILFVVAMLFATGPVLNSATGRLIAQNAGMVGQDNPE